MSVWRRNIDFKDFYLYDFPLFQDVVTSGQISERIKTVLALFQIPESFYGIIAQSIYDYCYGKLCNVMVHERWRSNFLGEISLYFLENGRYLQAYLRDVNKDIDRDDTSKVINVGEQIQGISDTKKTGNVENGQISQVSGDSQQQVNHELGDTLTVLNNQTTSTHYLASANEESYSRGSANETAGMSTGKSDSANVKLGMENGNRLSDTKDSHVTDTEGTKSPLKIATEESNFKFQEWLEPLLNIIDAYFTPGGNHYA